MTNEVKWAAEPAQVDAATTLFGLATQDRTARRNATLEEVSGWILNAPESRTSDQISSLVSLLSLFPKLRTAGETSLASLARQLVAQQPCRGEVLFRSGDPSDAVFLVVEGAVLLTDPPQQPYYYHQRRSSGMEDFREVSSEDVLQRLNAWELVGDESVLAGMRRPCRATVVSPRATLLVVPRHLFHDTIGLCVRASFNRKIDFLARLPVFGNMPRRVVERLAPFFFEVELGPRDLLCRQGDSADCMWALVSGRCHLLIDPHWSPAASRPPETDPKRTTQVAAVQSGQLIGEMCVFGNVRHRAATVRSATEVLLYRLRRLHFLRICPPAQLEELRAIAEAKMMLLLQAQREEQGEAARISRVLRGHSLRALHPTTKPPSLRSAGETPPPPGAPAARSQPTSPTKRTTYSTGTAPGGAVALGHGVDVQLRVCGSCDADAAAAAADPESSKPREYGTSILDLDADGPHSNWASVSAVASDWVRPPAGQRRQLAGPAPKAVAAAAGGVGSRLEAALSHFDDWGDVMRAHDDTEDGANGSTRSGAGGVSSGGGDGDSGGAPTALAAPKVAPSPTTVAALPFGWGFTFLRASAELANSGTGAASGSGGGGVSEADGAAGGDAVAKTVRQSGGGRAQGGVAQPNTGHHRRRHSRHHPNEQQQLPAVAKAGSSESGGSGGMGSVRTSGAALPATGTATDAADADGIAATAADAADVKDDAGGADGDGGGAVAGYDSDHDSGGSGSDSHEGGYSYPGAEADAAAEEAAQQLLKQVPRQLLPLVDFSWNFGPCSVLNVLYSRSAAPGTVPAGGGGGGSGVAGGGGSTGGAGGGRPRAALRSRGSRRQVDGAGGGGGGADGWSEAGGGGGGGGEFSGGAEGGEGVVGPPPPQGGQGVPPLDLRRCTTPDTPGPWSARERAAEAALAAALASAAAHSSAAEPGRSKTTTAFGGGFNGVAAAVAAAATAAGVGCRGGGSSSPVGGLKPLPTTISAAALRARAPPEPQQLPLQQPTPQPPGTPQQQHRQYGTNKSRYSGAVPATGGPHSSLLRIIRAPSSRRGIGPAAAGPAAATAAAAGDGAPPGAVRRPRFSGHLSSSDASGPPSQTPSPGPASPRRASGEGPLAAFGRPMGQSFKTAQDAGPEAPVAAAAAAGGAAPPPALAGEASAASGVSMMSSASGSGGGGRRSGADEQGGARRRRQITPPPPVQVPSHGSSWVVDGGLSPATAAATAAQAGVAAATAAAVEREDGQTPQSSHSFGVPALAQPDVFDATDPRVGSAQGGSASAQCAAAAEVTGEAAGPVAGVPDSADPEDSVPSYMSSYMSYTADGTGPARASPQHPATGDDDDGGGAPTAASPTGDGDAAAGGDGGGGDDVGECGSANATAFDAATAAAAIAAAGAPAEAAPADGPSNVRQDAGSPMGPKSPSFRQLPSQRQSNPEQIRRHTYGDWNGVPSPNTWAVVPVGGADSTAHSSAAAAASASFSTPFLQYIRVAAAAAATSGGGGGGGGIAGSGGSSSSTTHLPLLRGSGGSGHQGLASRRTANSQLAPEASVAQSLAAHRSVMAAAAAALAAGSPSSGLGGGGSGGGPSPTANALASLLTKGGGRSNLPSNVRQPNVILKGGFVWRAATGKQLLSEMVNGAGVGTGPAGGGPILGSVLTGVSAGGGGGGGGAGGH